MRQRGHQIDQLVTNMGYGDAISNHCLEIRRALRSWGYKSEIYAQYIDPRLSADARQCKQLSPDKSSLILLQYSIGSDILKVIEYSDVPVALIYHNVTPPSFFAGVNPHLQRLVGRGRGDLLRLRDRVCIALGDSEYNRLELVEAGFKSTGVLPILVDFDKYDGQVSQRVLDSWKNISGSNILFVGRISPNKRQDDLIRTFSYYKRCIDSDARLFLVGSADGTEHYLIRLKRLVEQLRVDDVFFTGQVSTQELIAYYRVADVFLSMSEHEGFCVPLLEAMHFDLPVVAYKSTAIPYTLGSAGVMFTEKRHDVVAELINLVLTDRQLRGRILQTQRERLQFFSKENTLRALKHWIEQVAS